MPGPGVRRLTLPLPLRPGHVHVYFLRGEDGWTLVDTGLALPDLEERLAAAVAKLDGPVVGVAVTHMHPDHVGGAQQAAAVTGARPSRKGCSTTSSVGTSGATPSGPRGSPTGSGSTACLTLSSRELIQQGSFYAGFIRYAHDPLPLREGDAVAGWEVLELPGHADGHLCLLRDGVLVAGDHLLDPISPAVGLYPDSRPDPLGDYLASLARTIELAPRLALTGHGEPIGDPAGRAQALIEHHRLRLAETVAALDGTPRSGYELSFALFG
jgi:glyoxylase-like metal-dependent hydrolase (beta-lactamase superfamily II)